MERDGLEGVRGEPVMVPHWVRGNESVELLTPRYRKLPMTGLGGSVGTPPQGITAEVLVVESWEELDAQADEARGRIVLFDPDWVNYGVTGAYRRQGAIAAARAGAVASLIRSATPYSIQTPHTGAMSYDPEVPAIPHAALTPEDARDSWDVGQGAMDDGGGSVAAWEAVRLMHELGLRPRRTVRVVLWTNEENGLRGANAYRDRYADQLDGHVLAMESDGGVFKPSGFGFTGSDAAYDIIREVGTLLDRIEAGTINRGGGGADIGPIMREGVPGMGLQVDGTRYFWYHHTDADTIDKLDPEEMARCVAAMAVMAYVVADLPDALPRD
jgi:carboxypeptidase Q